MPNSTTPTLTASQHRLLGLDAIRVLATGGVIWFHSLESSSLHASGVLGRSSVSFYTMAAVVFLVDSSFRRQRPFPTYALDRFKRLAPPFIAWSLITFLTLSIVNVFGTPYGLHVDPPAFSAELLLNGGTLHLWYIPFLLLACLLVYPAALWMQKSTTRQWLTASAALVMALLLDFHLLDSVPLPRWPLLQRFLELSSDRWSAIYWGVFIAIAYRNRLAGSRLVKPLAALGLLMILLATWWQWTHGLSGTLKTYGGLGLLFIALVPWNNPLVRFLAPWGRLSAGVYFAHMAAIYLTRLFIAAAGAHNGDWARDVVTYIGALLLTFPAISLLAFFPSTRWLAGLDPASAHKRAAPQPLPALTPAS